MKKFFVGICAFLLVFIIGSVSSEAYSSVYPKDQPKQIQLDRTVKVSLPYNCDKTYYKVVISKTTDVKLSAEYTHGSFYMYNSVFKVIVNDKVATKNYLGTWKIYRKLTLAPGTYYISYDSKTCYMVNELSFIISDITKPDAPQINTVKKESGMLVGNTVSKGTVYASVGDKTYSVRANKKGNFWLKTEPLHKGQSIKIWVKNTKGITGKVKKYIIQ